MSSNNARKIHSFTAHAAQALVAIAILAGCDKSNSSAAGAGGAPATTSKPAELVELSQFGMANGCALAVGADGTIHVIFSDGKEYGKPAFLYYRASTDNGATWSAPITISDDESVLSAGHCRIFVDGSGRVYAIWKYTGLNELLEGPNGPANGVLAYRVLDGGAWSKPRVFGDVHEPMTSWFAAMGSDGKVSIVYSRADDAVDWQGRGLTAKNANNLDQLTLDGAAEPKVTHIQIARHVMTEAEQQAAKKAKHDYTYQDTVPRDDGLWNLNGYIGDDGRPRFLAEKYPLGGQQQSILRYDGNKFALYYEYKKHLGYNSFKCPPALLRGGDGKEHVIRKPEVGENEVIRDYVVENGLPGSKTDVITNNSPKAEIDGWWTSPLDGGGIAAMASVSPDAFGPTDLYVAIFDGHGNWGKSLNVTDNDGRATFFAKAGMTQSTSYRPTFAAAATLKGGGIGVIMLNAKKIISGLDTVGVTSSGRAVTGTSSYSSEKPYVSFTRIKGN